MRIYLADLTHTGSGQPATDAFPLNIGLIASYAKKRFGDEIEVSLYKLPEELKEAIDEKAPDILGLSNYTWNCNLSYYFAKKVKSAKRDCLTVFGGTNYPFDAREQRKFLEKRPAVDLHVFYEGEQAFCNVIERKLNESLNNRWFDRPIDGCQFFLDGAFVNGKALPRISELDSIPSPYTNESLNKFFSQGFIPLVETARGCPFRCNFCNAGDAYYTKVHKFSDGYVREELTFIAKKADKYGITHLTLCDNNFGMIPRDRKTAEVLHETQETYGWPKTMSAWTGKNAKDRVVELTKVLGSTISISMSVQSLDDSVLGQIGRSNIRLDDYRVIAQELNAQGRPQHAEVIMPLPGETYQSHIDGLNQLLDYGVSRVISHTLQALHGTPYKDDTKYRKEYGLITKFRIVPLDFTKIDGMPVFDVEEVVVATNAMSFDEYVQARVYAFLIDVIHNSGFTGTLMNEVIESFRDETMAELWDSEEELIAFYSIPENYQRLREMKAGANVMYKHRLMMFDQALKPETIKSIQRNAGRQLTASGPGWSST